MTHHDKEGGGGGVAKYEVITGDVIGPPLRESTIARPECYISIMTHTLFPSSPLLVMHVARIRIYCLLPSCACDGIIKPNPSLLANEGLGLPHNPLSFRSIICFWSTVSRVDKMCHVIVPIHC